MEIGKSGLAQHLLNNIYNMSREYNELARAAGLIDVGIDEDGSIMWQGSNKQWEEYSKLVDEYENGDIQFDYADTDRGTQIILTK